jgi:hypothetical protein
MILFITTIDIYTEYFAEPREEPAEEELVNKAANEPKNRIY